MVLNWRLAESIRSSVTELNHSFGYLLTIVVGRQLIGPYLYRYERLQLSRLECIINSERHLVELVLARELQV